MQDRTGAVDLKHLKPPFQRTNLVFATVKPLLPSAIAPTHLASLCSWNAAKSRLRRCADPPFTPPAAWAFRGLLRLHSRYGPPDRSTAQGGLRHEASGLTGRPTKPLVSYRSLPTTLRVEPSSTGVPRRRGALNESGFAHRKPVLATLVYFVDAANAVIELFDSVL